MNMDEERDSRDLGFMRENKQDFFGGLNHYLGILRGAIPVPHTVPFAEGELSDEEIKTLSFGQFVSCMAQHRQLDMEHCANQLGIEQDDLIKIYDDLIFPWDLDPTLIKRIGAVLGISIPRLRVMIDNHPMDDWLLKQRLPRGFSAARTSYKLDPTNRALGLNETELLLQRDRESEKKKQLLTEL